MFHLSHALTFYVLFILFVYINIFVCYSFPSDGCQVSCLTTCLPYSLGLRFYTGNEFMELVDDWKFPLQRLKGTFAGYRILHWLQLAHFVLCSWHTPTTKHTPSSWHCSVRSHLAFLAPRAVSCPFSWFEICDLITGFNPSDGNMSWCHYLLVCDFVISIISITHIYVMFKAFHYDISIYPRIFPFPVILSYKKWIFKINLLSFIISVKSGLCICVWYRHRCADETQKTEEDIQGPAVAVAGGFSSQQVLQLLLK